MNKSRESENFSYSSSHISLLLERVIERVLNTVPKSPPQVNSLGGAWPLPEVLHSAEYCGTLRAQLHWVSGLGSFQASRLLGAPVCLLACLPA